jgi:hypothetical protein
MTMMTRKEQLFRRRGRRREFSGLVLMLDPLWTQKQAAGYLHVSTRYLRESSCPKVLLPGNGERGRALVRYEPATVRAWWQARQVTLKKAS